MGWKYHFVDAFDQLAGFTFGQQIAAQFGIRSANSVTSVGGAKHVMHIRRGDHDDVPMFASNGIICAEHVMDTNRIAWRK